MSHPLQCQCGAVRGEVVHPDEASRGVCYCKDCQAYARFLGREADVLDANGGTSIVATLPEHVRFAQGIAALASMSLSDKGLLRWYASCCKTPIGNTPRDFKTPYIGIVSVCLAGSPTLDESFGPVRAVLNTQSALGEVAAAPLKTFAATARIVKTVIGGRLRHSNDRSPFFNAATGEPIVRPLELSKPERERLGANP